MKPPSLSSFNIPGILALLVFCGLYSCKPKLDLAQRRPVIPGKSAKLLYQKIGEKRQQFQWITGKIEAKASIKGKEQEFTTNIRMRRDSVIWLSIGSLGIEGARILITEDSVKYILQPPVFKGSYFEGNHSYLQNLLKIEELDLCFVQSILLGEPVLFDDDDRWKGEIDSSFYVLKNVPGRKLRMALGIEKDEDFDLPADSLYIYDSVDKKLSKVLKRNKENDRFLKRYFLNDELQLVKMLITDVPNNRLLEITYHDFATIDSVLTLPQRIKVNITDAKESTSFELEFTKLRTQSTATVPFKIPEKYEFIKP